jgi:integrase
MTMTSLGNGPSPQMQLVVFCADCYAPTVAKKSKAVITNARQAVERACGSLCEKLRVLFRRDPLVRDLNGETLRMIETEGKLFNISPDKLRELSLLFRRIWRFAGSLTLVTLTKEATVNRGRGFSKNIKPDGSYWTVSDAPGTLWHRCQSEYFPSNLRITDGKTVKQYRLAFRNLTEFLGRDPVLEDLSDATMIALMRYLKSKGLAARTINESVGRFGALWKWLAKQHVVERFPSYSHLPEPKRIPKAWTKDDLARILKACRSLIGWKEGGVRRSTWWTALHLVLWDTGERISAVLAARWEWLDLNSGDLRIPAEARKGGDRDMEYRLHATTLEWVKALKPISVTLIFGETKLESVHAAYKGIRRKAGVATDRASAFHRMRRSVASHLHAAGHDATDFMKHSTDAVTRGSYLDPAIIGAIRPAEVLFRPEGSQEPPPLPACEIDESVAWL